MLLSLREETEGKRQMLLALRKNGLTSFFKDVRVFKGSVPTTPDPDTFAKVSRYKWEPYRDTNWWCIYYFLPRGRHIFAKVCHRNGRCIAILFKSIGVRGRFDSPD